MSSPTAAPPAAGAAPGLPPTVAALLGHGSVGAEYRIGGWIRTYRASKRVAFIALQDGSCAAALQVVLPGELPELPACQARLATGASVMVRGTLVASPGAGQPVELRAAQLEVLGDADPADYPLQKKGHGLEFLRGIAHLRPRSQSFGAIFRIRAALTQATHSFLAAQGFAHVHTPIITASDCEGAGETFTVHGPRRDEEFFGRPAMLTVSGQLNAEALAYGLGRVYTFGPTFRAENSNTVRHLSEFWMIEPEMAFADLDADIGLAEAYLRACVGAVLDGCAADLALLEERFDPTLVATLEAVRARPCARISYTDAVAILEGAAAAQSFAVTPRWGGDLQAEHERFLVEQYFKQPTVVTDYPRELKAFYMYQNDDGRTVAAMDLLVPRIGELIGGSQREHRLARLQARLEAGGMQAEAYAWYLDVQRFGAVPHAGFGLGLERLVMFCTGMANIRDVIAFPRTPGHAAT